MRCEEYEAGEGEAREMGEVGGVDDSDSNLCRSFFTDEPFEGEYSCMLCDGVPLLSDGVPLLCGSGGVMMTGFVLTEFVGAEGSVGFFCVMCGDGLGEGLGDGVVLA